MPLFVDDELATSSSRLSMVRMGMFMLRSMELWRAAVDDCEKALILLAIMTISGERFTRGQGLDGPLRDLRTSFPEDQLLACNVSSIAAATGFNRETTRRKVNELIEAGVIIRSNRKLRFRPDFVERGDAMGIVRRQLEAIVRLTNDLIRDGVVISGEGAAAQNGTATHAHTSRPMVSSLE